MLVLIRCIGIRMIVLGINHEQLYKCKHIAFGISRRDCVIYAFPDYIEMGKLLKKLVLGGSLGSLICGFCLFRDLPMPSATGPPTNSSRNSPFPTNTSSPKNLTPSVS